MERWTDTRREVSLLGGVCEKGFLHQASMSKSNVSHARFKKGKILEGLSEYQSFFFPFLVGLD